MKDTITITSKGQATLPIEIRRKLGLGKSSTKLHISFNEQKAELIISKSISVSELSQRLSQHIKPGIKPVLDVDHFYQEHRGKAVK